MRTKDITLTLLIFLIFIALFFYNVMAVQMASIKKNWPTQRCEPLVMPFAGIVGPPGTSSSQNFADCMKTMQSGVMTQFLQPMQHNMTMLGTLGGQVTSSMSDMRGLTSDMRTNMGSLGGNIFGIFINVIVTFQRLLAYMMDLVQKLLGIFVVLVDFLQIGFTEIPGAIKKTAFGVVVGM
jgi:hypothetical protein